MCVYDLTSFLSVVCDNCGVAVTSYKSYWQNYLTEVIYSVSLNSVQGLHLVKCRRKQNACVFTGFY